MDNRNKNLKISARIFGILNAYILLILFIAIFQQGYIASNFMNFLVNNMDFILYFAYFFLVISVILSILIKDRTKQEKNNVFFYYLALTSLNGIIFMFQVTLNNGIM